MMRTMIEAGLLAVEWKRLQTATSEEEFVVNNKLYSILSLEAPAFTVMVSFL